MKVFCALLLLTPLVEWGQANSDVVLMIDLEKIAWYALDPADSAKASILPSDVNFAPR